MSHYLQTFKELLEKYLKGILTGNKFYKTFSKYFYDENLKPQNAKEFNIIENLWGYLDIYESNKKKRAGYGVLIGDDKLRKVIEEALEKMKKLEGKK